VALLTMFAAFARLVLLCAEERGGRKSDKIELYAGTFDMLCTTIKCNNVHSWNYQQEISPQRSHVLRSYNDYDDMIFLIPEF